MNNIEVAIKEISIVDLEKYQSIEMHKSISEVRTYHRHHAYTIHKVKHHVIDLASEESIEDWKNNIDFSQSKIYIAESNNQWIGGCIVVTNSPKIHMLNQNMSHSVLWDIRVHDSFKHMHIGSSLFNKAVAFAKFKGCKKMIIETQNNNVPAILFYEKMGAYLHEVNKNYYEDYPDEDQLIFHYDL